MYIVAINVDHYNRKFSVTCRDPQRSLHWKNQGGDTWTVRDTREVEQKIFTVIYTSNFESEARKFKAVLEAGYIANGYEEVTVKVSETV